MRGEELPYIYTTFSGLMGDRVYGVIADDGNAGFPCTLGAIRKNLYSTTRNINPVKSC